MADRNTERTLKVGRTGFESWDLESVSKRLLWPEEGQGQLITDFIESTGQLIKRRLSTFGS